MVTEIRDSIDRKSLVLSTIIGVVTTLLVQSLVDPLIIAQRGRYALGGEIFLYAVILALVTFVSFQLITRWLHRIVKDYRRRHRS